MYLKNTNSFDCCLEPSFSFYLGSLSLSFLFQSQKCLISLKNISERKQQKFCSRQVRYSFFKWLLTQISNQVKYDNFSGRHKQHKLVNNSMILNIKMVHVLKMCFHKFSELIILHKNICRHDKKCTWYSKCAVAHRLRNTVLANEGLHQPALEC